LRRFFGEDLFENSDSRILVKKRNSTNKVWAVASSLALTAIS